MQYSAVQCSTVQYSAVQYPFTCRYEDIMSNPGTESLKLVSGLTHKIQIDHACNIQFTSGVASNVQPRTHHIISNTLN